MIPLTKWPTKPLFYFVAGVIFMIPVIWIARTSAFYLCYLPLIAAAILFSRPLIPEKKDRLPSILIRYTGFIAGMIVSEILFSLILIASGELSFQFKAVQSGWTILLVELVLGISIFVLFFAISMGTRFFYQKFSSRNKISGLNKKSELSLFCLFSKGEASETDNSDLLVMR